MFSESGIYGSGVSAGKAVFLSLPVVGVFTSAYYLRHYWCPCKYGESSDAAKQERIYLICGLISSIATSILVIALVAALSDGGFIRLAIPFPIMSILAYSYFLKNHAALYPSPFANP